MEKEILVNTFGRFSFEAHLPPTLENSANLIPLMRFYSKLKFSVKILKRPSKLLHKSDCTP